MKITGLVKFFLIAMFIAGYPLSAMAESNADSSANNSDSKEIDIATSQQSIFINLENLKPGDWTTKTLTVSNEGKQDFKYLFSSQFLKGSEKFYNELLLKVSLKESILYEGKLMDFDKLDSRLIKRKRSEELDFRIEMPFELGNEFQGLGAEFKLIFSAEGTAQEAVLPSTGGIKLPDTATDIFNLLALGALMITGGIILLLINRRRKRDLYIN